MSLSVGVALDGDSASAVVASPGTLGSTSHRVSVPAVLVITPRGVAVGAQAEQFAASGVGAVFRDFTSRVGDPVPVVGSDGSVRLAADLEAMTIGAILRGCAAGSTIAQLAIAHPSGWGPYEKSILHSALTCTEAEGVPTSLVNSPTAAVTAAVVAGMITFSETAIVADIGGEGTEVALVTGAENHVGRVVATWRTDDLGSAGLDRALARYVIEQVRGHLPAAELPDSAKRAAVADCRRARRDLVQETSTVVDVHLPARRVPVRVVRAEFEALAREPIRAGLAAIAHLMGRARENGVEVDAIVLTGESARTPLIAEMMSAQWPIRLVIPPSPKWATASGAAHIAARRSQPRLNTPLSSGRSYVPNQPQPSKYLADRRLPPRGGLKAAAIPKHAMPAVR
jgi:molecular chaperone DnaK (HSP70)